MEAALQVDLARPEAPVDQVLESALGYNVSQPRINEPPSAQDTLTSDAKWSVRGRAETTTQARLVPKSAKHSRSRSTSTHNVGAEASELGHFDESARVFALQPVDEGFGAWSYVASAFAMFIVVWGKQINLCQANAAKED